MRCCRILFVAGVAIIPLWLAPVEAAANTESPSGRHCLEEPRSKLYLEQSLLSFFNPLGPEHHANLVYCRPLITTPGLLFDYTNLQVGLLNIVSPVYVHQGGFLSITPLSVLQLRAQIEGVYVWPIDLDAAGHFPRSGYGDRFNDPSLPAGEGDSAGGYLASFSATFQGQVTVGPVDLILVDTLLAEYWSIGDAPYYYNLRRDLILAQQDWLLWNTALLLAGWKLSEDVGIRAGIIDEVAHVLGGDYVTHRIGLLVTATIAGLGETIRSVQPFVSVGQYTHHAERKNELMGFAGVSVTYDWWPSTGSQPAAAGENH
jgi:hypothetical protein